MIEESTLLAKELTLFRSLNVQKITETIVEREDSFFIALEGITEKDNDAFILEQTEIIYKLAEPHLRFKLTFSMSRDVTIVQR